MEKTLYNYVVVYNTYTTDDKGVKTYQDSKLIIDPTFAFAKTEKELVFKITRDVPADYANDPDNIKIIIRPF